MSKFWLAFALVLGFSIAGVQAEDRPEMAYGLTNIRTMGFAPDGENVVALHGRNVTVFRGSDFRIRGYYFSGSEDPENFDVNRTATVLALKRNDAVAAAAFPSLENLSEGRFHAVDDLTAWGMDVDGTCLAVADSRPGDNRRPRISVLDAATMDVRTQFETDYRTSAMAVGRSSDTTYVAFAEDAAPGSKATIRVVTGDGTAKASSSDTGAEIRQLRFNPDATSWLRVAEDFNDVATYTVSSGSASTTYSDHTRQVRFADYSNDGKVLATCGNDGRLILRRTDASGFAATNFPRDPNAYLRCGVVAEKKLAWALSERERSGRQRLSLWSYEQDATPTLRLEVVGRGEQENRLLAVSDGGTILATLYGEDQELTLWSTDPGRRRYQVQRPAAGTVHTLAFSPNSFELLVASTEELRVLHTSDGRFLRSLAIGRRSTAAVWSADGATVYFADGARVHAVPASGSADPVELPTITDEEEVLRHLRVSPSGRFLLGAGDAGGTYLWDLNAGSAPQRFLYGRNPALPVTALSFSREENLLLTGRKETNNVGRVVVFRREFPGDVPLFDLRVAETTITAIFPLPSRDAFGISSDGSDLSQWRIPADGNARDLGAVDAHFDSVRGAASLRDGRPYLAANDGLVYRFAGLRQERGMLGIFGAPRGADANGDGVHDAADLLN